MQWKFGVIGFWLGCGNYWVHQSICGKSTLEIYWAIHGQFRWVVGVRELILKYAAVHFDVETVPWPIRSYGICWEINQRYTLLLVTFFFDDYLLHEVDSTPLHSATTLYPLMHNLWRLFHLLALFGSWKILRHCYLDGLVFETCRGPLIFHYSFNIFSTILIILLNLQFLDSRC